MISKLAGKHQHNQRPCTRDCNILIWATIKRLPNNLEQRNIPCLLCAALIMDTDWQYECQGSDSPFQHLKLKLILCLVFGSITAFCLSGPCALYLALANHFPSFMTVLIATLCVCVSPALLYNAYICQKMYYLAPGQAKKLWDETHAPNDEASDLDIKNWLNLNMTTILKRCRTVE